MPKIFISYRRIDSRAIAERIYDHLLLKFGRENVFKDVNEIRPGDSFADVLKESLAECDVLLVVIGKQWLDIRDAAGKRRLDDEKDFVRLEVETGLNRSDIRVIPILVDGASLPDRSTLPPSLQKLPDRQTLLVRYDPDFRRDMEDLIHTLQPARNPQRTRLLVLTALISLALVISLVLIANPFNGLVVTAIPTEKPALVPSATVNLTIAPTPNPTPTQASTTTPIVETTPETRDPLDFPKTYAFYSVRDGVRIRLGPNKAVVAAVNEKDLLRLVDGADLSSAWLQVRTTSGIIGYVASGDVHPLPATIPLGVNIDPRSQVDNPEPAQLGRITWVRFIYNVSMGTGNQDLNKAYSFYDPIIQKYADAGYKVMLVFTHQTFGEGAGYVWSQMDDEKWTEFIGSFAAACTHIADHYKGKNLVTAYQIWNEQDTPQGMAYAAVPIPPESYSDMLTEAIRSVRDTDPQAIVLSGGLATGPSSGSSYIRDVASKSSPDTRQDGIAIHPYGRGVIGSKYAYFGSITEDIQTIAGVFPNAPIWMTEWGVLDRQNDLAVDVEQFANGAISLLTKNYSKNVAGLIWFGWSDNMYNAYGLVDKEGKPKPDLYEWFTGLKS